MNVISSDRLPELFWVNLKLHVNQTGSSKAQHLIVFPDILCDELFDLGFQMKRKYDNMDVMNDKFRALVEL